MKRSVLHLGYRFLPIAFIFSACLLLLPWKQGRVTAFSATRCPRETLIIDAGHGGEDGGAVSLTGVPESHINLAIARKLDQTLGLYGIAPVLLRTEDCSLHDANAKTLREMKASDLRNRVAAVEAIEDATLISIHQNTFPNPKYHGAQVFYANEALSLEFAQCTQEILRQTLDPQNNRVPGRFHDTVYLMKHITCRAILVECGFLSNPDEDKLLQTDLYQTKISAALAGAWLQAQAVKPESANTNEEALPRYESKNTLLLHGMRQ